MKQDLFTEGSTTIYHELQEEISKDLSVFYNPIMKHNRDISIALLAQEKNVLQCCDLLAGSGVRSIRFLQELKNVKHITINDYDLASYEAIQENLKKNKQDYELTKLADLEKKERPKVSVTNLDANQSLLASSGYNYIDIDPFGSPNSFLDAACKRVARNGILAITLTDTSAPAGSYPDTCLRKYWATPCEGLRKHEVGLRIVVRKVQLVAAQYDRALEPILCYNKDHYYRFYFRAVKSKQQASKVLGQHGVWEQEPTCGPLWLGRLSDPELIEQMIKYVQENNKHFDETIISWLQTVRNESLLKQPGYYYHMNELQKVLGSTKKETLLEKLPEHVKESHYEKNALRTDKDLKEIKELLIISLR